MKSNVCIIGAGPAGMIASIFSAMGGAETLLIDSNTTTGRKLLHTGRGRCNITHTGGVEDFVKVYGGEFGRFLKHSLYEFSGEAVREFFLRGKLETKVEKDGCVFPMTDRATDVKRVLVDCLRSAGVKSLYGKAVERITKDGDGFILEAGGEQISCRSVIIATGGVSWSHTGCRGDGYRFAKELGHSIVPARACLVPLVTAEKWPAELAGTAVGKVVVKVTVGGRRHQASGAMMFTHEGIGGPVIFDLSRLITDSLDDAGEPVSIYADFSPDTDSARLDEIIIENCQKFPRRELAGALSGMFPRALALSICKELGFEGVLSNQLTKEQRKKLVGFLKGAELRIKSTRPIEEATVTRGGVSTAEIDNKTMESKICKGVFFVGEVINVDGPCGGYNLQIAWSTGALAGRSAAKKI